MSVEALLKVVRGEAVDRAQSSALLRAFAAEEAPPEILASFLTALHIQGEGAPTLLGFIDVLREHMVSIELEGLPAIDLCGTGGDGQHTVNLSTAAAFVTAAAGVPVAKHGNHGVSSKTGSADVLAALGVPYKLPAPQVRGMIRKLDLGFIYAPAYHPLFARIGPVRRLLGFRTAFNLLGPLCNPAHVKRQVIGVPSETVLRTIGEVVAALGTERTMVVHTPGPYDEVSLTAPAQALLVSGGRVEELELAPSTFGARTISAEALKGSDAIGNAHRIQDAFNGGPSPLRDAICANAACALFVAGRVPTLREGFGLAQDVVARGQALKKLHEAQTYIPEEACHVLAG